MHPVRVTLLVVDADQRSRRTQDRQGSPVPGQAPEPFDHGLLDVDSDVVCWRPRATPTGSPWCICAVAPDRVSDRARAIFATLVTRSWAHDAFLTGAEELLQRVDRWTGIPAVLVHGRHDISSPVVTAWRLHARWPSSRLVVVESEGHGGPLSVEQMALPVRRFARDP